VQNLSNVVKKMSKLCVFLVVSGSYNLQALNLSLIAVSIIESLDPICRDI